MKLEVDIEILDVYYNLKSKEREDFLKEVLGDINDEALIKEVISRKLVKDIIEETSDEELLDITENRLGNIINLIRE